MFKADESPDKESAWQKKWLMRPEQFTRFGWEMFIMVFLLFLGFLIPYISSFEPDNLTLSNSVDILSLIVFSIDIIINFNTGFYEKDKLILNRGKILKNYLSFWFWVDLFSTIPIDWALDAAGANNSQASKALKYIRILRVLKLIKLVRLTKLKIMILQIEERISNKKILALSNILKLLMYMVLVAHFIACIMYSVASENLSPEGFVYKMLNTSSRQIFSIEDIYVTCLYWAFTTMACIGYGDISPVSTSERAVCVIIMIISSGIFGIIIGNIGSIIEKQSAKENARRETIVNLNSFMKSNKLSKELTARTRKYMEYVFIHNRNHNYNLNHLLSSLSQPLQEEVMMYTNGSTIANCKAFSIFSKTLINKFAKATEVRIFSPQDSIIIEGQKPQGMYFINSGLAEVFDNASKCRIYLLSDRNFVGEIGLFIQKPCVASISALRFLETLFLSTTVFYNIIELHPNMKNTIEEIRESCKEGNYLALHIQCYLCKKLGHIAKNCCEIINDETVKHTWVHRNDESKKINPDTFVNGKFVRMKPERVNRTDYSAKNVIGKRRRPREIFPKFTHLVRGIVSYLTEIPKARATKQELALHTEESVLCNTITRNNFNRPEWILSSSDEEQPIYTVRKPTFDMSILK